MRQSSFFAALLALLIVGNAVAYDHRVEKLNEPAPQDEISKEIAGLLATTGTRVIRGTSRTVCDIWLCKQWDLKSLEPGADVNYPFVPGQLIGVARYARKGSDFRDQDIDDGVYTLRYGQQPVDGSHVGTSPTRDFLLLISAKNDKSAKTLNYETLVERSNEAAGSGHPCLLSMKRVQKETSKLPSIRNEEQHDWWIVRMASKAKAGDKSKDLPIDLIVVGQAAE